MNFTNTFLASTNQISYESTNPEKAKETMKRAMKATIKLQQARYILDLFQQLKRKNSEELKQMEKGLSIAHNGSAVKNWNNIFHR